MNISAVFIKRPVATTLLTVGITLVGAIAFKVLPVSPLPQVDFPTISVSAGLPGGSPEIMASSIATPLERQFSHVAGVTEMTSSSSLGSTSITLQFDLSRNIDGAARDVEAAINAARTYLPANLPGNPTYRKVNPADSPIMILGLTSDKYDKPALYDYASSVIAQKLSQLQGVGQVSVGGGAGPSVRVEVNPTLLNSHGLTMSSVQAMLSQQNVHEAVGQIADSDGRKLDIITNDQMHLADDYKPLVIGYHNGQAVRLSDVADVENGAQNIRASGYMDGIPSITVIIFRQPGANIIETNDRIEAELPSVEASIPQGIKTTIVLDRTTTIRASVNDVERSLVLSVVLVVLVVFMFLRSWRATLIPFVAVPASLIATFAVMYLLGFSIDNLSLMALTISTGFVVDDAIVVMENISRLREDGMSPMKAAFEGSRQIGFTIFSISMSLIAVFIPILLMAGIVGRLFREFAITLSTAIVMSMLVSLTTTPMMCAYILKDESKIKHGRMYRVSEKGFASLLAGYSRTLRWVLDHPWPVFVILLLTIALNFYLIAIIPKGFFPQQDTGAIVGGVVGPQDASFPVMDNSARALVSVIKADPAVAHVNAYTGQSNGGFIFMALKPLGKQCVESSPGCGVRQTTAPDIINRLRPKMNRLPVAQAFLQAAQDLRIGGRNSAALYQYTIQSDNVADLSHWGPILLAQMKTLPGFQDVNSDAQNNGLQELLNYDRPTAARLGITPASLDSALYSEFGQSEVSIIYTQLNQYYVVLEVAPPYWQSPDGLKNLYLSTTGNGMIPLSTVAKSVASTTPLIINHTSSFPSVTVSFNLANGMSMSDATREVGEMQQRLNMPETVRGFFAGTAAAYQTSLASEPILVITAILAVYIVLGILYESLVHPLTIISTLPSASVGAMLALMAFKIDLNVISIIGIILLIGIVKKNAIMMIDFALVAEREEGKTTTEAIYQACRLRFRPILMTTMAAIFGALPLAFGTGTGSELRRPLGITIVGGLIMSQILTLYTTPVVYILFDWARLKVRGQQPAELRHGTAEAS
ncbi:MAG: efflux RND transporter permease subunit [Terracidiphilus sp.]